MKSKQSTCTQTLSYRPILIHVNGVDDDVIASEFFAEIVDFGSFLKN